MTRPRFLHLGVNYFGVPLTNLIEYHLDQRAPDWLRYSPNTWIIWTGMTPQEMSDYLQTPLVGNQYLITVLDASAGAQGLFNPFVWDWINRPRDGNWTPPPPAPRRLGGALGRALQEPPMFMPTFPPTKD